MTDITKEVAAQAPPGGFSSAEYSEVATGAVLEGIILLENEFKMKPGCLDRRDSWRLSHGRSMLSCTFSAEKRNVAGIFEYNIIAKDGNTHAAKCSAKYVVFYRVPKDATEEAAKGYCRNVGMFAAYPYFRALASRFSSEANLDLPILPAIASTAHIPPKSKKSKKKA